jgi:hypothetical protein
VHRFVWEYLDWEGTDVFGEEFIQTGIQNKVIVELVRRHTEAALQPFDERFFARKKKLLSVKAVT